jgi:hypothetical protein
VTAGVFAGKMFGTKASHWGTETDGVYLIFGFLLGAVVGGIILAKNMLLVNMAENTQVCAKVLRKMNTAARPDKAKE